MLVSLGNVRLRYKKVLVTLTLTLYLTLLYINNDVALRLLCQDLLTHLYSSRESPPVINLLTCHTCQKIQFE